ncbi:Vegetative incompatibility protein HET-E-1 [Colletotrichum orbiculare MAFF 240422]|uniref:Vegetative incompatibility protein HET-E-1 n=1 Tax=Colletotrichum orbiculare (strain 104-T / ATCC 96160 / CBS 514.97 / LARS 414 / MAFF 240422) TaxID=1213857 RepID=A0A484FCD8_COLOR|nr:Vegetative incompatibility protein HET-E-1 [Colletotrichum orbiculare MAFF 240422]
MSLNSGEHATGSRRTWDEANQHNEQAGPNAKRHRIDDADQTSYSGKAPSPRTRLDYKDYTVGWVSALPLEMRAAKAMLDNVHEPLAKSPKDSNTYVFGDMCGHNVVIACLPSGQYGIAKAAIVANNMQWSFPCLAIRLMVGIGGGAPGRVDVRLGDVVVSHPEGPRTGVVQYDFGKTVQEGHFQASGVLNKPPPELLTAVSVLRSHHQPGLSSIPAILAKMVDRDPSMTDCTHPGVGQDRLYEADYDHIGDNCDNCDLSRLAQRPRRSTAYPRVYYGEIASANQVMKHGLTRDRLARERNILCFEMEAAGLMDTFPCLVIRGVCDYSDSHKAKQWQPYAAATAAAYAKELLSVIPPQHARVHEYSLNPNPIRAPESAPRRAQSERWAAFLAALKFDQIDNRHSNIKMAHAKTCQWLAKHSDYSNWLKTNEFVNHHGILWISGKPGAGKSTIMKFAFARAKRKAAENAAVLSFFFNARGEALEKTTEGMYRSLLLQLLEKLPELQTILYEAHSHVASAHASGSRDVTHLRNLFSTAVSNLGERQVTCFIDALDECAEDEVRQMLDFFEDLGQCAAQNNISFYVCFSSRHYPHMSVQYGLRLTLEDQVGHTQDLQEYVCKKLKTGTKKQSEVITASILEKASGVFMWVVLVVDILNKEFDRGRIFAVQKRLSEIPPGLSELFMNILTRDSDNLDDLLLSVQWILFSKRPLNRREYYFALTAGLEPESLGEWDPEETPEDSMDRFVLSSSKGLAEMTKAEVVVGSSGERSGRLIP